MFNGRGWLDKHIGLLQGVGDSAAGDVEVFRLDLNADELAAELDGGNASCAAAHEWVEDTATIIWELLYAPLH